MRRGMFFLIIIVFSISMAADLYSDSNADVNIQILCDAGIQLPYAEIDKNEIIDRLTAVKSVLNIIGLYDRAKEWGGEYNFNDVDSLKSSDDISVLGYVRARKIFSADSLGNFYPYEKMKTQDFYKAMLGLLGYTESTSIVSGDFDNENVLKFAEKLGFDIPKDEYLTYSTMAKIMVQTLKINIKDGIVYAKDLIDKERLSLHKAIEAGLYIDSLPKIQSAKAISNFIVEVILKDSLTPTLLLEEVEFSIKGLTIINAFKIDEKTIYIETTSQKKGEKYTLTHGEDKASFTGVGKVTAVPYITSVKITDSNTIEINFNRLMDYSSAANISNYNISDIEIKSIHYGGKNVTLNITELMPNKNYNISVNRLKSIDKVSMDSYQKPYYNKVDLSPPVLLEVKVETNNRLALYFDESLDKASAQDISNYSVLGRDGELKLIKASVSGSSSKIVKLTMETQKTGSRYELTIKSISDNSVNKNTIRRSIVKSFYGMREDKTAPILVKTGTEIIEKNKVRIIYFDNSGLDEKTVLDPKNYEIIENNKDAQIIGVSKASKESYSNGMYKVILAVDTLNPRSSYNLTVYNITDEFDNTMVKNNSLILRANSMLAMPPRVEDCRVINNGKIELSFNKALDKATAEDINNYTINKDIDAPMKAAYSSKKVTLLVDPLEELINYTLKIEGVEDIMGYEIKQSINFTGQEEPPYVLQISQYDDNTFGIVMSEEIKLTNHQVYMGGENFRLSVEQEDRSIIRLSSTIPIDEEKEYSLDLSQYVADLKNIKAKNKSSLKTVLQEKWGEYVDRDKPFITKVISVDETVVEVWYNEELSLSGTYDIEYYDEEDDQKKALPIKSCEVKGYQVIIRLVEDTPLEEGVEYKLKIKIQAKDMAGNYSENNVEDEFNIDVE